MTEFVTSAWLAGHLGEPRVVVVDGSWYLPQAGRDPRAEYLAGHIPGAIFFDLDAFSDQSLGLPHMLLPAAEFAEVAGKLGIGDGMRIVVYDGEGLFSAPRVAWNFAVMGARDVAVLEGGLPGWRAQGRPTEPGEVSRPRASFTPRYDPGQVADLAMMRQWVNEGGRQIVDARPGPRFRGEAPEPRPNTRGGHMPGARSAPALSLVENGLLRPADELRTRFAAAGVDLKRPIVTTCGSGVTAATLKLALERAGATDVILYDGSWAEWGGRADTEVTTGSA